MRIVPTRRLLLAIVLPGLLMLLLLGWGLLHSVAGQARQEREVQLQLEANRLAQLFNETLLGLRREASLAARVAAEARDGPGSALPRLRAQLASASNLRALALAWPESDDDARRVVMEAFSESNPTVITTSERTVVPGGALPEWLQQAERLPAVETAEQWLPLGSPYELSTRRDLLSVLAKAGPANRSVMAVASLGIESLQRRAAAFTSGNSQWLLLSALGEVLASSDGRLLGRPYTDWGPAGSRRGEFAAAVLANQESVRYSELLSPELGPVLATWANLPANGWQLIFMQQEPSLGLLAHPSGRIALAALLGGLLILLGISFAARRLLQRQLVAEGEDELAEVVLTAPRDLAPSGGVAQMQAALSDLRGGNEASLKAAQVRAFQQEVRLRAIAACANDRLNLSQAIGEICVALPGAFPRLEPVGVRIQLDGQEVQSLGFVETTPGLTANVVLDEATQGSIAVCSKPSSSGFAEGDQALLDELAGWLADKLRREQERQQLLQQRASLQQRVESRTGALQQTERMLRDIINSMPGVLFQMVREPDSAVTLRFVSAGVEQVFGVNREQVISNFDVLVERIYPEDYSALLDLVANAEEGEELATSFRITHAISAELRWVRVTATVLRKDSGATVVNGTWMDVTEQKTLELELESSRTDADAANESKSRFLANMSHEIRTPMNAIIGLTHLAHAQSTQPKVRDQLRKVEESAHSLLSLLNDILDFSKIEAGRLSVEEIAFDLKRVLDRVEGLMAERAAGKGLKFEVHLDPAIPHNLVGDPLRLSQVLLNLVSNAVKFTEEGFVDLSVELLEASATRPRIRITVNDSGPGMDDLQVSKLFSAFQQADSSTTRRYGGTGLGLTISRQLVTLMGGELTVRSGKGKGSSFRFTLELDVAEKAPTDSEAQIEISARPALPLKALREPISLKGVKVLVVDDNDINLEIASELLKASGVQVAVASSGAAALKWLAANSVDAVLMDVQMPMMDGYTATGLIRKEPRWLHLPVIAMTANAMAGDRERCLAAGMNDHIPKPIDPRQLREVLGGWVMEHRLSQTMGHPRS